MRPILKKLFVLSQLTLAILSVSAFADEVSDIDKLIRAGQTVEALRKVDTALVLHPKDAQMRFLKGLILTQQNKPSDAIAVFSKLSDDYPELPEPYNNLAVLYAANGQYDKARASLESAIRVNPTYGTAQENLGDVYAKLASQAYDKALQLDPGNATAKQKSTLVHTLVGNTTSGTNAKVTAKTPAAATQTAQKPVGMVELQGKADAGKTAAPEQAELIRKIENWAQVWSEKNTEAYLAHYAPDFQPASGAAHKTWVEERRNRIGSKGRIDVKLEDIKVAVNGDTATVQFRQIYISDKLTEKNSKTLVLAKTDGKWLIKQERATN